MAYTDFTLEGSLERFGLHLEVRQLVEKVVPQVLPDHIRTFISQGFALSLRGGSEKARSEFVVAPMLLAVRQILGERITIHSGLRFDVDKKVGLVGECDFLISSGNNFPMLVNSAVLSVVEAKKQDIELGLGQCIAQMVAAQQFNIRKKTGIERVYGCVTNAEAWQFLRLEGQELGFDRERYVLTPQNFEVDAGVLLGVFDALLKPLL
jgi:hypothetical protein